MSDRIPECGNCKHGRFGDFGHVYGGSCQIPLPGPLQVTYHQNHTARHIKPTHWCAFHEYRSKAEGAAK